MEKINILPVPENVNPNICPVLQPVSLDAIETWYRNLGPERDMRTVPLEMQLDAISSSVLLQTNRELPETPGERIRQALPSSKEIDALGHQIALGGAQNLFIADLALEMAETRTDIPAPVERSLFTLGCQVALDIRDNPLTPLSERIKANTKLANLQTAALQAEHKRTPGGLPDFSDRYIKLVRREAAWMSSHSRGAAMGNLFEVFVGTLSKYQLWASEQDDHLTARHATEREDAPSPRRLGGSGHNLAHDVIIKSRAQKAILQCKWGPSSEELTDRYDRSRITFLAENTDDGTLATVDQMIEGFEAIATSSKPESAEKCDKFVHRYNLNRIITSMTTATEKALGYSSLVLVS